MGTGISIFDELTFRPEYWIGRTALAPPRPSRDAMT